MSSVSAVPVVRGWVGNAVRAVYIVFGSTIATGGRVRGGQIYS